MPVRPAGHRPGGPAETPEYKRVTVCAQANAREPPLGALADVWHRCGQQGRTRVICAFA